MLSRCSVLESDEYKKSFFDSQLYWVQHSIGLIAGSEQPHNIPVEMQK